MTSIAAARTHRPVLADLLPGARVRDILLVLGGTALVAVLAQVAIPLPGTPVPLTLGTFAVLLTGATLGPLRAGLSLGLYLAIGLLGAPVFASGHSGWNLASFGYIIGYLLAAVVVGRLARLGADRTPLTTFLLMAGGSALIYAAGVPWLMGYTGYGFAKCLAIGVVPFLIGDAIKAVVASVLLPTTWKLTHSAG